MADEADDIAPEIVDGLGVLSPDPRVRAAATKRARTAFKLREAADVVIMRDGLGARAEDIAAEAGVSVASFYNVYPSRFDLYDAIYKHKIADVATWRDADSVDRHFVMDPPLYFKRLLDAAGPRSNLVRGRLIARLESPPSNVIYLDHWTNWYRGGGEDSQDFVQEIAHDIIFILQGMPFEPVAVSVDAVAIATGFVLNILDSIARGVPMDPAHLVEMASSLLEPHVGSHQTSTPAPPEH